MSGVSTATTDSNSTRPGASGVSVANPAFGTRGLYVQVVRALGAQPSYLIAELMA